MIALASYDEIYWAAGEEKDPWLNFEFHGGTVARVELSDVRRSKCRRGGGSLSFQSLPDMEVVCKSDKFLTWKVASFRAADHPMNPPSPSPIPPSGTEVDTEVDTALDGLVVESSAVCIVVTSSILGALQMANSWLPSERDVAPLHEMILLLMLSALSDRNKVESLVVKMGTL